MLDSKLFKLKVQDPKLSIHVSGEMKLSHGQYSLEHAVMTARESTCIIHAIMAPGDLALQKWHQHYFKSSFPYLKQRLQDLKLLKKGA